MIYKGKEYREVQRKAKKDELIKIVVKGSNRHVPRIHSGDVQQIIICEDLSVYTNKGNVFFNNESGEYVVLEPIERMTDAPHPEIAEGSTFRVVDDSWSYSGISNGDILTLTHNDNTKMPYFNKDKKMLLWRRLAPINIIYKKPVEQKQQKDDSNKQCADCKYAKGSIFTEPCGSCWRSGLNRPNWEPKEPVKDDKYVEIRCEKCGQVVAYDEVIPPRPKRVYTAAQIAEARDIVYRIMFRGTSVSQSYRIVCERNDGYLDIKDKKNKGKPHTIAICLNRMCGTSDFVDGERAVAFCSDTDTWNDDIGRLVALCKLTGEKMPDWIRR